MTTLLEATQIANLEIDKILQELETKFSNIDYDNSNRIELFYIKCDYIKNHKSQIKNIVIRFIPDYQRQNPKVPKNLKEYLNNRGIEELIKNFKNSDKDAWKCEIISNLSDGRKMEYGININEKNFSKEVAVKLFNEYLIEK